MARNVLLSLENFGLTFGGTPIFEDATLHIQEGDKTCLVGRNGAGKTTLMKLITGEFEMDSGTRFCLSGTRIGYLAQQVEFTPTDTIHQFVMSGLPEDEQTEDQHYLADMVIAPLDLDTEVTMKTLSGGQVRRAALARALISQPDILLLDEPTNHLDIAAIEWLETYLAGYRGALICVSHDRAFLNNVSRKVFWIDRGRILTCSKGYAHFDEWAEQIMEQEARTLHNMGKKLESEHQWTQGGVTGRRKRNVRRMRELHALRAKLKADKASYNQTIRTIDLDPLDVVQSSKIIAEFKDVSKSFENPDNGKKTSILQNFNLRVMRGDRIGILGKNGSGKSTFLKLLMNELTPDAGRIKLGKKVEITYFDQQRIDLNPKKTVWQTLNPDGGDYVYLGTAEKQRPRHVCGYLKDFLFDPRIARDYVSTLSGGQQNRLLLARILANPGNVLILDEPTNDLDMDTLDMLQGIIADYTGTLFIVSHDRDFLDRTVTQTLVFEGDAVVEGYIGGYTDYLEAKLKKEGKPLPKRVGAADREITPPTAPARVSKEKMSFKLKHELDNLPTRISEAEAELTRLKILLDDPNLYMNDPEAFDQASLDFAERSASIEEFEIRWLELEAIREAMEA